jgi:DNA-directed RNA polymerase subunit RPC12/RpoP
MESEVYHRIRARHVYENELRRHAVSTKKATFRLMKCLRCQSKILLKQGHQHSHQCDAD